MTVALKPVVRGAPDAQPLLPELKPKTLAEYLSAVSDFWAQGATTCRRCWLYEGAGYCGMLHDRKVPSMNCLGLLERDGVKQPHDQAPNAALTGASAHVDRSSDAERASR